MYVDQIHPATNQQQLQFNSISVTLEIVIWVFENKRQKYKIVFKFFYEGKNWNTVNDVIESEMAKHMKPLTVVIDCKQGQKHIFISLGAILPNIWNCFSSL